jgi:sulfur-oxidizing protein SoxY
MNARDVDRGNVMKNRIATVGLALSALALLPNQGHAASEELQRAARWKDLQAEVFGARAVLDTDSLIVMDAPDRAVDAAYFPITLTMPEKGEVAAVYLFIDDNPSPYAAHFTFGPAADPTQIKLRVRVDSYTDIHAVVETKSGALYQTSKFVKAAGGCSAPIGVSDDEARKGMGEMRLKFAGAVSSDKPAEATLMIRHPNFNGMQMNPFSGGYTPARFIREVDVSAGDKAIFKLNADISLSSDPVITFRFAPQGAQPIKVSAVDSQDGRWEQSFETATTTAQR